MKQKNGKTLLFSVFLCFLLVISVSCVVVQPGMSAGKWSDPLPVVDGNISVDDVKRSDHIQISDVQIMSMAGVLEWTSDFDVFMAANSSHLYVGVNITNIPFLANVTLGGDGPTDDLANATFISLYLDNDNNGTIDYLEDSKYVYFFNETAYFGEDQFWNNTDPDDDEWRYEMDHDIGMGPNPQNITAVGVKHSNPVEQGSLGNLTLELFMHVADDLQGRDGGGLSSGTPFGFAIRCDLMVNGILGGDGGDGPPQMENWFFGETTGDVQRDEYEASGFTSVSFPFTDDLSSFAADGHLTQTEKANSGPNIVFSNVEFYRFFAATASVDIYVANNASHLYIGVKSSGVPYLANYNWTGGTYGVGYHNFTVLRVVFDNDNNNNLDHKEDAKMVLHGNNSFSQADDQLFNTTADWDPLGQGFTSDSQYEHSHPPVPGDITAYDIKHSNPSSQGAIGVLTMELTMPLADDASGYDGGGLSGTVGFAIHYMALINFNTTGGAPSFESFLIGSTSGVVFGGPDASGFHDLVIEGADTTDPLIDSPDDVTYEEDETGNSIPWTATDANPYMYSVTRDGVVVEEGYWDSGEEIEIDVDGLSVGDYTYVCTVNDTGGNSASDEVTVTVTEPTVSEFPYGYVFIALITLPLIALIAYIKTRKLKV